METRENVVRRLMQAANVAIRDEAKAIEDCTPEELLAAYLTNARNALQAARETGQLDVDQARDAIALLWIETADETKRH